jgi:hypothetical protein
MTEVENAAATEYVRKIKHGLRTLKRPFDNIGSRMSVAGPALSSRLITKPAAALFRL